MKKNKIKITYLFNSGFAVEINDKIIIFDYCLFTCDDEKKSLSTGVVSKEDLEGKSSIVMFVSHSHKDHFNAAILRMKARNKNIKFIFSDDIPVKNDAILMREGEFVEIDNMKIWAYPSTDIGVSFLVQVDGVLIFHAGDLNLWFAVSNGEMQYRRAKFAYMKALRAIRPEKEIDIAFFPLDPRIGLDYDRGALLFVRYFHPKLFVPMHFENHFEVCTEFEKKLESEKTKVLPINKRGYQYEL